MKRVVDTEQPFGGGTPALILLVAAVALRGVDFGNPVINVDEEYYLLVGGRLAHGLWPYLDLWDRKPLGLFAIYAAIRALPGDGVLAYQLVATVFAAVTAWLVAFGAREVGVGRWPALASGGAYLIWVSLLGGRGGQSPVFYDLFIAAAALLTLRLPTRASPRSVVQSGAAACLLAGLAIQTKYTPVFEGAYFGLVHLVFLWRLRAGRWLMASGALLWAGLGIAPTALAALIYASKGPTAFHAWWFANFASIMLRHPDPTRLVLGRLAGIIAQIAPLGIGTLIAWRIRPRPAPLVIAWGWLGAAMIGFLALGTFFSHYALPLVAPLAVVSALTVRDRPRWAAAMMAVGLLAVMVKAALTSDERRSTAATAAVIAANDRGQCPFIFAGDPVLYSLAHACPPTRFAFPAMLSLANEAGAQGIDDAVEVRAIIARRPPLILTREAYYGPWNPQTEPLIRAALKDDYRLVFTAPRENALTLVYLRRDLPLRR